MKAWVIASVGAIFGVLAGCLIKPGLSNGQEVTPVTKTYQDRQSLKADELPYKSARLILAGTSLPVEMNRVQKGNDVSFRLVTRNEVLETERFQSDATGFRFAGLSDEHFVPPIPLVRYPFIVGESWQWSGVAGLGPNEKAATANLRSDSETINLAGGVHGCIVVVADLVVHTSTGTDSKRTLKFWIEPQKGLIKREFGFSSTREPRPAGSP